MNQVLTLESKLEFEACFYFEYATDIDDFFAQPEGFHYLYEGKQCSYTPDFLILYKGEKRFIEIKPLDKTQSTEFIERFVAKKAKANQKKSLYI